MKTLLTIYSPDGTVETAEHDMDECPGLDALRAVLRPIFGGAYTEHVAVLHEGRRADMFVDEAFHAKGLPRNAAATAIYQANWMEQHPDDDPEDLPWIAGDAVLFGRPVWS